MCQHAHVHRDVVVREGTVPSAVAATSALVPHVRKIEMLSSRVTYTPAWSALIRHGETPYSKVPSSTFASGD